nr:hypothetical protein [Tanacetum cinerariifolium]
MAGDGVTIAFDGVRRLKRWRQDFGDSVRSSRLERKPKKIHGLTASQLTSDVGEKDDITTVLIWVKFNNVPIVAYLEIKVSLTTTKLDKPIMLDRYMSTMCITSLGRNFYARALIEVSAENALIDSIIVVIPLQNGSGHMLEAIDIKYEWKPPRYDTYVSKPSKESGETCTTHATPLKETYSKTNTTSTINVESFIATNAPKEFTTEELARPSAWVKFHDVPVVAYTSDGLSLIALKFGNPLMLDSYTNSMCLESWGRSSYARVLIEINACNDFLDNLVMVSMEAGGSLLDNLASMVKNSDGNLVGKNDVPMSPFLSSPDVNVSLNSDHAGSEIGNSIPKSFESMLKDKTVRKMVKLAKLTNDEVVQGVAVEIPLVAVKEGEKDDITTVLIWVKFNNVPIVAYLEIKVSLTTTKLDKPIMLDRYMSTMCITSLGRNFYARALIEVSAENALMDSIIVVIPLQNGSGHMLEAIDIKYEWKPPRYDTCKNFDHNDTQCPKKAKVTTHNQKLDDGFMEVTRKNEKGKHTSNS